jgi:hypothetical protein
MPRCGDCTFSQEFYPAEDGEPGKNLCFYPVILLPLSMAGVANRERETVDPERTDCPCWTAKETT